MKKAINYALLILAISIAISILFSIGNNQFELSNFFLSLGLINLVSGVLNLVVGVILLLIGKKENGQTALLAGGLLLTVGATTCTIGFSTMNSLH